MSADSNSTSTSSSATDELLKDLDSQGEVDTARADAISQEPDEDIDAFLAELEGDQDTPAPAQDSPKAADPFADAFAQLEQEHATLPPPPAAIAAPAVVVAPPPVVTKKEPSPKPDAPEEALVPVTKKEKEEKKKATKPPKGPKVVEGERTAGFKMTMAFFRWSFVLLPVLLFWWLAGAFFGPWFKNGLMLAAIATGIAFVVPLLIRLISGKGQWAWWALGLAILGVAAFVGPWPHVAGQRVAHYGHWPSSTVAQAAGWAPDHFLPQAHGSASEFMGHEIEKLAIPADAPSSVSWALGTEHTLAQAARALEKAKLPPTPDPAGVPPTPEAGPPPPQDARPVVKEPGPAAAPETP